MIGNLFSFLVVGSVSKSGNLKEIVFFNFFCLETKETKIQDLDLFAKKFEFLLRKSPNLRGNVSWSSILNYCRASDTGDFYDELV